MRNFIKTESRRCEKRKRLMLKTARESQRDGESHRHVEEGEKERADQSCSPLFLQRLIWSSGRLCDASSFILSHSTLALVSFREIRCPPWAVYKPARQPAQPGHAAEKSFPSYLTCSLTCSSFFSSSLVSNSLSFLL